MHFGTCGYCCDYTWIPVLHVPQSFNKQRRQQVPLYPRARHYPRHFNAEPLTFAIFLISPWKGHRPREVKQTNESLDTQ